MELNPFWLRCISLFNVACPQLSSWLVSELGGGKITSKNRTYGAWGGGGGEGSTPFPSNGGEGDGGRGARDCPPPIFPMVLGSSLMVHFGPWTQVGLLGGEGRGQALPCGSNKQRWPTRKGKARLRPARSQEMAVADRGVGGRKKYFITGYRVLANVQKVFMTTL